MSDPLGHVLVNDRDPVEHFLVIYGRIMAISGGLIFIGLIIMSLVSVIGRKLGFGSVTGDIELMQAGTAIAATAFLPYCTLLGEHIKVEFFTENMNAPLRRYIDGIAELLFAGMASILAWRTALAAIDAYEAQEVTTLVSLPLWIPTALLVPGVTLMIFAAFYRSCVFFHPTWKVPGSSK
jgi:TRAP-type C4-dicarboxylate transport system permease small subunit